MEIDTLNDAYEETLKALLTTPDRPTAMLVSDDILAVVLEQFCGKLAHAVHRNRLRRQLREIYRLHEAQFARGYDIVVVARTRAIGADYAALERAYLSLAAKLGLLGGQTA